MIIFVELPQTISKISKFDFKCGNDGFRQGNSIVGLVDINQVLMMIVFRLQMFRNTLWKRLYRPFKVNTEIYNTLLPSVSLLTFRHPLTTACTRGRLGSLKYRMYSCAIIVHVNHKWGLLSSSPTIQKYFPSESLSSSRFCGDSSGNQNQPPQT